MEPTAQVEQDQHDPPKGVASRRFSSPDGSVASSPVSTGSSRSPRRYSIEKFMNISSTAVPPSSLKIVVKNYSKSFSDELEQLRVQDISTAGDTAADRALAIAADDKRSGIGRLTARKSIKGDEFITQSPSSPKKTLGREIQQGHEQYALTYGMMLGIRVMTGRDDIFQEFQHRTATATLNSPEEKGTTVDSGRSLRVSFVSPKPRESCHGHHLLKKDTQLLDLELTDKDFSYEIELKFPPEGAKGDGTPKRPFDTPPHKLNHAFKFKDYMPKVFRAVRSICGVHESDYMLSVAGNFNYIEFIANSKSGQFFFYSYDGKYMIKTQTKEEAKLLRRIMPEYVNHLHENPNSLLCRFYGMHRVKMKFLGEEIHFVIMGSVFDTNKTIHTIYDLKGSTLGRITKQEDCDAGAVQKDLNLANSKKKILLGPAHVKLLADTLRSDIDLLTRLNVMDYSLLIGIHDLNKATSGGRRFSVSSLPLVFEQEKDDVSKQILPPTPPSKDAEGSSETNDDEVPADAEDDPFGDYVGSVFTTHEGGVLSAGNKEIYFMGVIDILQVYNTAKQAETFLKGFVHDKMTLSAVDARTYGQRFINFILRHTDYYEYDLDSSDSFSMRRIE
jgi:1-phosphatidylinositol-4-phosphate 5-kinase